MSDLTPREEPGAAEASRDAEERKALGWFEGDAEDEGEVHFKEYEITASPNDFNTKTIVDFVSSGAVRIPGFQRNYVWDLKRASRLIESLLIGLPIPQIFLYEEKRNSFLVIDGQQRLMSIFYFVTGRFPRREGRPLLRRILDEQRILPKGVIEDDRYFQNFNLDLRSPYGQQSSQFHSKNYDTLGDYQTSLDLRTIRNVIIKQTVPEEERDSSVFEIFNRLNTGGVNLAPQEIRASLYHSDFIETLRQVNLDPVWRGLIGQPEPDLHQKDTEILLRVIALAADVDGTQYREPMSRYLNQFSRKAQGMTAAGIEGAETVFRNFFGQVERAQLAPSDFEVSGTGRFNITVFEAVFRAACSRAWATNDPSLVQPISRAKLANLRADAQFIDATKYGVGRTAFVNKRYERALAVLSADPAQP